MALLMPGAEPFFYPAEAGRPGVVLIHGFTATPNSVAELGRYLASQGLAVIAPRLPGHGTDPRDLARARWSDWYCAVLDACSLLGAHSAALWVVGLSLGALLALHLAANADVQGVAALSTPLTLRHQRLFRLGRGLPVRYVRKRPGGPAGDANLARYISYPVYPWRAVLELVKLQEIVRAELPGIRAPALLIHSHIDAIAPAANMLEVYRLLGSAEKTMHWLARSDHIITMDHGRGDVFRLVGAFIARGLSE